MILLPQGDTKVGSGPNNVIILKGSLMSDNHAVIRNDSSEQSVEPLDDALIVVNGDRINQKHSFQNGDRIIFGQNHFFVFRGPNCPMDQNIVNFDEMNHEYLEKQKMEHRFGSFWRLISHVTCDMRDCQLVSLFLGLLGTRKELN